MITFSELQRRELIHAGTGERIGFLNDLQICSDTGKVISLILHDPKTSSFFKKGNEIVIYWEQILIIGADVILIKDL